MLNYYNMILDFSLATLLRMSWDFLLLFGSFGIGVALLTISWKRRKHGFVWVLIIIGIVVILLTGFSYYIYFITLPLHTFLFSVVFYFLGWGIWGGIVKIKDKRLVKISQ